MVQTAIWINNQDCTTGDGNSPEEYEAIAVMLLRAAQAVRNLEEGRLECLRERDESLLDITVHHCPGDPCPLELERIRPTIEKWRYLPEPPEPLRKLFESLIEEYRRAAREGTQ